jgi:UDP-N-acetylmuramoyl-L-alanyl-D-glutamate--2,6-diaminopimelate ligase
VQLDALLAAADLPAAGVPVLECRGDLGGTRVLSITLDSRASKPGTLYCCVPGHRFDGHDFAPAAVAAGAVALLCEKPVDVDVPQIVVRAVRPALGPIAATLHGHPAEAMTVVGVTGTNGKTTTTHLVGAILGAAGRRPAVLGTLGGERTTPEAPELQAHLAELREEGVDAVAMEVSSHALDQHRVDGMRFAAATFTNLTLDHLDYHGDMSAYFEAKAQLFQPGRADVAVINASDPWGRRLLARVRTTGIAVWPFSLDDAEGLRVGPEGSRFRWRGLQLATRLAGRFNVGNALAAATTAQALGVEDGAIVDGLAGIGSVRGRFQPVDAGQPFTVLVDYAHTPDGLEQALAAARELCSGRLIVVFGCGGDRDRTKRPLMGATAARLSDLAVLTSDNPRSEDPERIIAEIAGGASGPGRVLVDVDRTRAISTALETADVGDVVVIAGKGHETGQEINGHLYPFDDADVARDALDRILHRRSEDPLR